MHYTHDEVLEAARVAYRATFEGDSDSYVERKAAGFAKLCHKLDRTEEGDDISQKAVKEAAFSELDPYSTNQLYLVLDSQC